MSQGKITKQIFNINPDAAYVQWVLLILRLCAGAFMLTHGIPKLMQLLEGGEIKFADPIGMGEVLSFVLVVFAEAFCSFLIIIGLVVRLATIPLIINMIVIIFIVHVHDPIGKQELPVFYLVIYICLLILGSGKYSLDSIIYKKMK